MRFLPILLAAFGLLLAARPAAPQPFLELELIDDGFSQLVDIVHAGDDRLLLGEQGGRIRIYASGGLLPTPFLDISALMGDGFEGGLKSVAFHPDYPVVPFFFVHYTDLSGDTTVARYRVSDLDPDLADPISGVVVLSVPQSSGIHQGGGLRFGADGFLYLALGDGGGQEDPFCRGQRPDTLLGKILRLDIDQNVDLPPYHGIPAGNPFGGPGEPAAEVWAVGLRNPWRISFDRLTGDFYVADVGQDAFEEVSRQAAGGPGGANFGWKVMEGAHCFDADPIDADCPLTTPSCFSAAYTDPIIEYDHTQGDCSITGGYVYRGSRMPDMFGRYLYGDWCSGRIWAASEAAGNWSSEVLNISVPRILAFGEDAPGEIYVSDGNSLWRITQPRLFDDGFEAGNTEAWSQVEP